MRDDAGFSLLELVVVVGLIGLLAAVALPNFRTVLERNRVITSSDLIAGQIREARLAAITRNTTFRVVFDCPTAGAVRMLAVTGTLAIDGAADRCTMNQPNDGPALYVQPDVMVTNANGDAPPSLVITGRGLISAVGGAMPLTLAVSYGTFTRNLVITAAGRVRTPAS